MDLYRRLNTLMVFRDLLEDEVIRRAMALLGALEAGGEAGALEGLYCAFVRSVWERGGDISPIIEEAVCLDDNFLLRAAAAGKTLPLDGAWLGEELALLNRLANLQSGTLLALLGSLHPLPAYACSGADVEAAFHAALASAPQRGYGIFARYPMFFYDGAFRPVPHPDPQRLEDLRGYGEQRQRAEENLKVLLQGGPANNVLLYGDAGTGKSSTVKGLVNKYFPAGLRLVQPAELELLPKLLDSLAENPLKFILFIDDLSLRDDEGAFTALKGVLEGGVRAKPRNVAVYATSNRRHLVRESFQGREGDELHLNDTLQESASLSARFGLVLNFSRPERELYLDIVRDYAALYGLKTDPQRLAPQAEAFAIRAGGRTPRAAKQFVEQWAGMEQGQ